MSLAAKIPGPLPTPALPVPPQANAAEFRTRMGSISRQSGVYFAGTLLTAAAGYFFRVYIARALGAEALGQYALGMSIVGFVALFSALGLPLAASRFVAEYSGRRDYSRLGSFLSGSGTIVLASNVMFAGLLIFSGPWFAARLYHAPALGKYFVQFALIMFFGAMTTFLGQIMAGYRDVGRRTLITHFFGTPANMIFAIVLISLGFGLTGYLSAQVLSGFIVLITLSACVWKMTPVEARQAARSPQIDSQITTFAAAAFAGGTVDFLLTQADKIVLGVYLDAREVGIYAVAMAVVTFVPVALQSVNQIFSPTIAELYATGNHALLQRLYTRLTKWVLVLTLPLALAIIIFSRGLMEIFGPAFASGAAVLVIGTIGQLVNCAVGSVGYLLLMSGHQLESLKIQATNAALIVGLALVVVPEFGARGAALSAALAVVITNIWSLILVSRKLGLFPYDRSFLKLAPPAVLCVATLLLLRHAAGPDSSWQIVLAGLVSAFLFFLGGFVLLGLDADDRMLVRAVWAKVTLNS